MDYVALPKRIVDGDFSGWLREAMAERRVTQRALAMRSGVHHSTISRILSSDRIPSLTTAIAIFAVLGTPALNGRSTSESAVSQIPALADRQAQRAPLSSST